MTPTPPNMGPAWKIVSAVQGQQLSQAGTYVKGWNVTYQLAGGSGGSVFVPGDAMDLDAVRQAVAAQAANLGAVLNLTSDG